MENKMNKIPPLTILFDNTSEYWNEKETVYYAIKNAKYNELTFADKLRYRLFVWSYKFMFGN